MTFCVEIWRISSSVLYENDYERLFCAKFIIHLILINTSTTVYIIRSSVEITVRFVHTDVKLQSSESGNGDLHDCDNTVDPYKETLKFAKIVHHARHIQDKN